MRGFQVLPVCGGHMKIITTHGIRHATTLNTMTTCNALRIQGMIEPMRSSRMMIDALISGRIRMLMRFQPSQTCRWFAPY